MTAARDPVVVTLNAGSDDDGGSADTSGAKRDTTRNLENLTGGAGNDRLVGDGAANVLAGGDGDDTLLGGAGTDVLVGGNGADVGSYEDR